MKTRQTKADLVISSKNLYSGRSALPVPGAVAVSGNKIINVGPLSGMSPLIDTRTQIIEFRDQLIIPGFQDFHTHLYIGSCLQGRVCLAEARSEEEAAGMVGKYAETLENINEWIIGYGWYHVFWKRKELPGAKSLDRYIKDRPVLLFNMEFHGCWINSKAMEICGINRNTPDPPYGRYERDNSGRPTGFLYETAIGTVVKKALDFSETKKTAMFEKMQEKAAAAGITTINDMQPLPGIELDNSRTYTNLESQGLLKARIYIEKELKEDLGEALKAKKRLSTGMVRFAGLKAFVDGVATTYTALLTRPYSDNPGTSGITLLPREVLEKWIINADRLGFRVRLHACGDGSVKLALRFYEEAKKHNGRNDSRHTIEHLEVVDPADLKRMANLGVIASIQPEHMAITEDFSNNPYPLRLGSDSESRLFMNKSFIENGIVTAYASDYPVVDMQPLKHIFRAVIREFDDGNPPGGWNKDEKVSVAEALNAYTSGPAFGNFSEDSTGTIETGKLADIAVIDRNIFTIPVEEIKEAGILLTVCNGKIVYRS